MPQDVCTKTSNEDKLESGVINYAKTLLKTFVIVTIMAIVFGLRSALLGRESNFFGYSIFIMGCTLFFSLINAVDPEVYKNIMLGLGIALGLGLMGIKGGTLAPAPVVAGV